MNRFRLRTIMGLVALVALSLYAGMWIERERARRATTNLAAKYTRMRSVVLTRYKTVAATASKPVATTTYEPVATTTTTTTKSSAIVYRAVGATKVAPDPTPRAKPAADPTDAGDAP